LGIFLVSNQLQLGIEWGWTVVC